MAVDIVGFLDVFAVRELIPEAIILVDGLTVALIDFRFYASLS